LFNKVKAEKNSDLLDEFLNSKKKQKITILNFLKKYKIVKTLERRE
jgi:hypothetical protein